MVDFDRLIPLQNNRGFVECQKSNINQKRTGEIDSIFIETDFRGMGIGDAFMRRALEWMETQAVKSKMLTVAEGNEKVFAFYKRYSFYPRTTVLMQRF
jgi:ribosomal protein S18 acetylase RimI-like enzyme